MLSLPVDAGARGTLWTAPSGKNYWHAYPVTSNILKGLLERKERDLTQQRKAVLIFCTSLVAVLGFYALGLRLGRSVEQEKVGLVAPPSPPASGSRGQAPDPRPELDFINNRTLPTAPAGPPGVAGPLVSQAGSAAGPRPENPGTLHAGPFLTEQKVREAEAELRRRHYPVKIEKGEAGWLLLVGPFLSPADSSSAVQAMRELGYVVR